MLEGLLEQQTGLNPVEIMTDTAGTSDIIFGLFWLLGYQFSPVWLMPVKLYSGEWINRQITEHLMSLLVGVQICRRQKISGMR